MHGFAAVRYADGIPPASQDKASVMSDIPGYLPPGELAAQAAARVAGHVRRLRTTWPSVLADQRFLAERREEHPGGAWPEWCWLTMGGTLAALQNSGRPFMPTDVGFAAAVGQWRLTGRHIVVPSVDVAEAAIPGVTGGDPADMDLRLPREDLLTDLARHCYYLVMPRPASPGVSTDDVHGCYIHLEHDERPGQGAELRLLIDHAEGLLPVPVLLSQPTLAWSAAQLAGEGHDSVIDTAAADMSRIMAWWVWPLIGALLDHSTDLAKTMVLDTSATPVDARGAQVWEISYGHPAPRLSPV